MNGGPAILIALAAVGYALAYGAVPARRRPAGWRVTAFMAGLATLGAALASPLEGLAGGLFAAHMGQHMLLAIVAPPLLALGQPLHVGTLALPVGARRAAARVVVASAATRRTIAVLVHPVTLALAINGPLVAWHVPSIYESALSSRALHDLEHLMFLLPPVLFWLVLTEPAVPRQWRPNVEGALLVLFATWMICDMLGATLALTGTAWYPAYDATDRWGLSPVEDQRLGGLIMWVGGGVFYGVAMLVMLVRALRAGRPRAVAGTVAEATERGR